MMNFDERLAAAKARPRKHRDVPVVLDQDAAEERDSLIEALAHAEKEDADDQRLAGPPAKAAPLRDALEALNDSLRESLVTLRFLQLPGDRWAELTSRHPARADVDLDKYYGYNLDAVIRSAAKYHDPLTGERYGFRLDGDTPVPLEDDKWDTLFHILSGSEVSSIRDAVWSLNEYEPGERIEALVKGFGAATRSATK